MKRLDAIRKRLDAATPARDIAELLAARYLHERATNSVGGITATLNNWVGSRDKDLDDMERALRVTIILLEESIQNGDKTERKMSEQALKQIKEILGE